jgi:hypothetical protein
MHSEIKKKISQTESHATDMSLAVWPSLAYRNLVSEPGITRLHTDGSLRPREENNSKTYIFKQ